MIFRRKIYQTLLDWKENASGSKALLIEGARRIGKSTIAEEFARREYDSYLLIDFSKASTAVTDAFNRYLNDLDSFFLILSAEYHVSLIPGKSLIIFDEVQFFPKARQAIKHLVKDGRFAYLETGSLISIRENVSDILIPSEERHVNMYPMDFEEFCLALGEEQILTYIRSCFQQQVPLTDNLHHKAMLLLRQYMLVGGMPQSVAAYLGDNRSFLAADREKRDILSLYRSDISKAEARYRLKVSAIFDQLPAFLSKHEKRVRLSSLGHTGSYDSYADAFFWLADAMIVNNCYNCQDPNIGLTINEDRTFVKCYMGDTGLLISHAFTESEIEDAKLYRQVLNDDLSVNQGMLFENIIAQSLAAAGYPLYYYTRYSEEKHRSDCEIDFIISNKSKLNPKIFPIEVKSSKRYTIRSLTDFEERYRRRIGQSYVLHTKNLQRNGPVLYLPAYMTFCL